MEKKRYILSSLLVLVLSAFLLAGLVIRTLLPRFILPQAGLTEIVLVSLIALVLEQYLGKGEKINYLLTALFAVLSFGVLPFAACYVGGLEALKLGILGGAVFTAVTWIFKSMMDRLSTGPAAKIAPVFTALGLYLACQCLMGLI